MAVITGAGLLNGTNDPDTITGSAGADTLNGLGGNDTLQGAAGADVLDGGEGSDTMIGGADNDTYVVDNTGDSIVENAAEGTDRVNTSVSYVLSGGASVDVFTATGSADVTLTGNEQSQFVIGNSGGNFIDGGSDQIAAGGAVTEIVDTMQGGLGNDTYVVRNTGDVVVEAANAGVDTVLVAQFSAAAAAATASSYTLGTVESVEVFAALTAAGTEAINLTGNALAQTIQGNAGANSLSGGGGSDTLTGLAGSDTYVVTNSGVTIVEADGAGSDVLQLDSAVGDYTLGAGVSIETVTVTGVGAINVTGNEFNQSITGNTAANLLSGGTGEDTLTGGDGSDTYVVNSSGDVVVETGTGTDRIVASQSFAISTTQLVEQLYAAGGSATSSVSDQDGTLSINGLNTTSGDIFLVGSRGVSQTIVGNAGANILDGNRADTAGVVDGTPDTLAGLGGDDIYRVYASTDVVHEDRAGGFDRVFASASYDLSANSGTFGGTTYYTTGQAEIELLSTANNSATTAGINLTGNGYGQIIVGNFGANSISGGYGAGGTSGTVNGGVEALIGLNGDDTYLVTSANTFVYEDAGTSAGAADVASVDATVVSSFTLNGGSHVETLQTLNAAGTEGIALVGNELAQNIIGNAGANTLSGGGVGVGDTLNGGAGNDTYRVFNGNDTIVDSAGTDSIFASGASYQLATGVAIEYISTAVQGAGDNIFLVGNDLQQSIIGNYGDNTLDGNRTAGGASETTTATNSDTLIGLFGSDIYRVYGNNNDGNGFNVGDLNADGDVLDAGESNISGDVVIEQAGNGNYDQVFASGNYQLRNGVEVEALSASNQSATSGNYILRGNSVAQLVVGNNAANTIDGRGGNDTLTGGGGNDVFAFTSALSASGNVDQITDFTAGDRIGLSTGIFTGVTYTSGVITQAEFTSNTTGVATDASQRIIFNSATGQLFYDADGSGSGASVLFAQVAVGTQLGFNDFISQGVVVDLPAVS